MEKKYIETKVCARYFIKETAANPAKYNWLCAHGYGQLAEFFIRHFQILSDEHKVIAPEGLHRFYLSNNSGRVGASWMTKLEREQDVVQYCRYLDKVIEEEILPEQEIIAFGFSQGSATIGRWICKTDRKIKALVLWAGAWPHDMIIEHNKKLLQSTPIYIVIGDQDQYLGDEGISKYIGIFDNNGIAYTLLNFRGDHRLDKETLIKLSQMLELG